MNLNLKTIAMVQKIKLLAIILCVMCIKALGQEIDNANQKKHFEVGSETRYLKSKLTGQEYKLYINLPRGYEKEKDKKYPVLYQLDGQYDFPTIVSGYNNIFYDGMVPEIIIVGITWGGENPDYETIRMIEFTPTKIPNRPNSGGAPEFLANIKDEIVPLIEKEFRALSDDRALSGSSAGGIFTYYAMTHTTNFFKRFIISSPMFYDEKLIFDYENEYSIKNKESEANVFMVMGEYENTGLFKKVSDKIKSRAYKNLVIETRILDQMGHAGSKGEAYTRGMLFIYKRPMLKIDEKILKQYTGTYEMMPGTNVEINIKNGNLNATMPDGSNVEMLAASETSFYIQGAYLKFEIKKDKDNKVEGASVETFGGNFYARKIIK